MHLAFSILKGILLAEKAPRPPRSALFTGAEGKAAIYGLFRGQGTSEVYFDELHNLFEIYKPYVGQLIKHTSKIYAPSRLKSMRSLTTHMA
jgi:fatty acid synthase subunit alpha, fungi type